MKFVFLTHGVDTLEVAYFFNMSAAQIDFEALAAMRDGMDKPKDKAGIATIIGGMEWLLKPHGTASGYPFVISNNDFSVQFGEFNNPAFFVRFRSKALWENSLATLHDHFLTWAAGLGMVPTQPERISRVDICFDYSLTDVEFDEDWFVSLFKKDQQHRGDRVNETLQFGKGNSLLRVYDKIKEISQKSNKVWFYEIWGQEENVWRFEFQLRKEHLRGFDICTIADFNRYAGTLLKDFIYEHTTLRVPTGDSNRSRWPLHPLWLNLQGHAANFKGQEQPEQGYNGESLEKRLIRNLIIVYGYLKQIAALRSLIHKTQPQSFETILTVLPRLMMGVHDPVSWPNIITKKMDQIRLDQHG